MDIKKEIEESLDLLKRGHPQYLAKIYFKRTMSQIDTLYNASSRNCMEAIGFGVIGAVSFFGVELAELAKVDISEIEKIAMKTAGAASLAAGIVNGYLGIINYSKANTYRTDAENNNPYNKEKNGQ